MEHNDLENEFIKLETWLGQQMGYKQNHKGYIGRVLREIFDSNMTMKKSMDGDDTTMGMRTKVALIWKSYIGILCTISAILGFVSKEIFQRIF